MNWRELYFGRIDRQEVLPAISDPAWQEVRLAMKGKSLEEKYNMLITYKNNQALTREVEVRLTNYVTALSRGGLIKVSDYR